MVVAALQLPSQTTKNAATLPPRSRGPVQQQSQEFFWVDAQIDGHQASGLKGDRAKHSFVNRLRK